MRILVTGGSGCIGSHVVDYLLEQGHVISVFDRYWSEHIKHKFESSFDLTFYKGDVRNLQDCMNAVEDCSHVIHLAALINVDHSIKTPLPFYDTNVKGTFNMLEASRLAEIKRFVYMSSFEVYGQVFGGQAFEDMSITQPTSPYASSKYAAERATLSWGSAYDTPEVIVVRGANIYGPRQASGGKGAVIGIFIDRALKGLPLKIYGDGSQTRDYVYVADTAKGVVMAALSNVKDQVINLCSGKDISIQTIAEIIVSKIDPEVMIKHVKARPGENMRSIGHPGKCLKILGWHPTTSFEDGIDKTINYFKNLE